MLFELTKKFRFESAHRLINGYEGKCKNVHGHSWNGHIALYTTRLDGFDMAIDFSIMGKFLKMIEEKFDHKLLVHMNDKELIKWCDEQGADYEIFNGNPTCETIAMTLFDWAFAYFSMYPEVHVKYVQIEETCTTSCRYKG